MGSPAPAWLPSPSVLMFSRLPRLALLLDIWNKNTHTASSPAQATATPRTIPHRAASSRIQREDRKFVQAVPAASAEVSNTSLFCIFHPTITKRSGAHEHLFMDLVKVTKHCVYFIHKKTEVERDIPCLTLEKVCGLQQLLMQLLQIADGRTGKL